MTISTYTIGADTYFTVMQNGEGVATFFDEYKAKCYIAVNS